MMTIVRALMLVLAVAVTVGTAEASHRTEQPRKHRVVYHLTEPGVEKARAVLGNIVNHVNGVGGWDHVEALELVVHGQALRSFVTKDMDPALRGALDRLQTQGLALGACGNTMMELQEAGYAYIRP